MKKSFIALVVSGMSLVLFCGSALAGYLDGYANITIPDLNTSTTNTWYAGTNEDQEVEPYAVTGQQWDLEGFFLQGTTLALLGGFDFINGEGGITSGDIFIDVTGDAEYGPPAGGSGYGNTDVNNTFGYDYVLDLNFQDPVNPTYSVFELIGGVATTTVTYSQMQMSNPWLYAAGGASVAGGGDIGYMADLTNAALGDNIAFAGANGSLTSSDHNLMTFDLGFLPIGTTFTAHFTMECGNDDIMATGTTSAVPEPATIFLLGSGLFAALGGATKRKIKHIFSKS